jgi:hypothetical protein
LEEIIGRPVFLKNDDNVLKCGHLGLGSDGYDGSIPSSSAAGHGIQSQKQKGGSG